MEITEPIRTPVLDVSVIVFGSGFIGLIGWLTLVILVVLAGITIVQLVANRQSPLAVIFFGCAHVQGLIFLLCIGVCGIQSVFHCCCGGLPSLLLLIGQLLISLGTGLGVNLAYVSIIALMARRWPSIRFVDIVGLFLVSLDILFLLAIPMMVLAYGQ